MMTASHSGDNQAFVFETHILIAKKKGKSVVDDESMDNLVSLISKNQELKITQKQAWLGKQKDIPDASTLSDLYGPMACMKIVQSLNLSMQLKVHAIDYVMGLSPSMQICFVLMDPTLRVAWLTSHIS